MIYMSNPEINLLHMNRENIDQQIYDKQDDEMEDDECEDLIDPNFEY